MIVTGRRAFLGGLAGLGGLLAFGPEALARGRRRGSIAVELGAGLGAGLDALDLGRFEGLASLLQETEPDELQRLLVGKLRGGLALDELVAAAALANARGFGGQDYTGYHCFMALMPAFHMAQELDGPGRALPVLKVIHRNARRIQETGGRRDALGAPAEPASTAPGADDAHGALRAAYEARDLAAAERALHATAPAGAAALLADVESILRENLDVHRVVLAWRAWDVLALTGEAHAETLLRQSVRFCVDAEARRAELGKSEPELRSLLPALLSDHGLGRGGGARRAASDAEIEELADVFFGAERADAARAAAEALARGLDPEDVGRALSLAANRLLLHDPGRARDEGESKPAGSVHGASVGVHAADAARAWRNLAAASADPAANLIAGAYHTAGQARHVGATPYPFAERTAGLADLAPPELVERLARAVAERDQPLAGACAARYGALDADPGRLFATLLAAAVDADGALHAEKYYRTAREDFASARPAHRWLHAVALARVSASQSGFAAPGVAEARAALG